MECKVAKTAPISARIQNYAKASTELNPEERGSLNNWFRFLKNPYVFGLLNEESVPKNPR
jgi:hypothetical protein